MVSLSLGDVVRSPRLRPNDGGWHDSERVHPFATKISRWLDVVIGGLLAMSPDRRGLVFLNDLWHRLVQASPWRARERSI